MTKIIAELCQNHLGDRNLLGRMIEAAAEAGADYIKTQVIFSDDLTKRERFEQGITLPDGTVKTIKRPYEAEKARLAKLDLSMEDHAWVIEKCKQVGVTPLTTIFARHRIKPTAKLPWPEKIVKVASYDCASYPFLRELAEHFDHLIVSTGATFDHEIEKAAKLLKSLGKKFTFLHCVTSYPNSLEMCHLNRMNWLRKHAEQVGWSDHTHVATHGVIASKVAIALGADMIERHFTILDSDKTKDGPVSINPEQLKELDEFRRMSKKEQIEHLDTLHPNWTVTLGEETREMTPTELLNRDYYRGRFASPHPEKGWLYNWEENNHQS